MKIKVQDNNHSLKSGDITTNIYLHSSFIISDEETIPHTVLVYFLYV